MHEGIFQWLQRHPRFRMRSWSTSSSWINLVERFFGELTAEVIHDGSFTAARRLASKIEDHITEPNLNPTRYAWEAKGKEVLRKVESTREALAQAD